LGDHLAHDFSGLVLFEHRFRPRVVLHVLLVSLVVGQALNSCP
jgi:hypothetical protein